MKIADLRVTPLFLPLKKPYYWAQGVQEGAELVLIEIEADNGLVGYGETYGAPDLAGAAAICRACAAGLVGASPYDIAALSARLHKKHFAGLGPGNQRILSNQILAGFEMALWDLVGKAQNLPVHRLLGGALRDSVAYFGFVQGDGAAELAESARAYAEAGTEVIYLKIGRGDAVDLANVAAVRAAIGDRRLRLDANEAWDMLTARRMIKQLERFDIEFVEQPCPCESMAALAQLRNSVAIPIAADQRVHTPEDVLEVCRQQAADVIVLGLHEAGGLLNFKRAAAVAEAGGLNVCIHGVFETGLTTAASHQVGLTVANLDDGNQIMPQLLARDIVKAPSLAPDAGRLAALEGPGLGVELDQEAIAEAAERHRARKT